MSRVIRGPVHRVLAVIFPPDRQSRSLAGSMAIATNTFSPMSAGTPGVGRGQFSGDSGYGVNRLAGGTAPMQAFFGAVAPIAHPSEVQVGLGAGVSGQPGMPSSGTTTPAGGGFSNGPGAGMGS